MRTIESERVSAITAIMRVRRWAAKYAPYFLIPLTLMLVIWFLYVALATYNFSKPQTFDFRPYRDVFTQMPRNLNLVLFLLVFLASAIGPGNLLLRPLRLHWCDSAEEILFSLATGLIVYTFGILVIGTAGLLQGWICVAILTFACLSTVWYGVDHIHRWRGNRRAMDVQRGGGPASRRYEDRQIAWSVWLGIILALYLFIALLGALSPETQFDARYYHLGQVRSYVLEERFYNYIKETRIDASALDPYQMVLYTYLWKMGGMLEAKLLHWGDALVTALALIYFCRTHFRSTLMGIAAALIFISTPVISWSAGTAGNDLQLSLYTLLSVHAFLRWNEGSRSLRWLIVLGAMGGYAFASKENGLFNLMILFGTVLVFAYWTLRKERPFAGAIRAAIAYVLLASLSALIACLPWLLRSYIETGNPFFPLLNPIIHSPFYDGKGSSLATGSTVRHIQSLVQSMLTQIWKSLTMQTTYRAVLGPLFIAALPVCASIAFLKVHSRIGVFRFLSGYVALWMGMWLVFGAIADGLYELRYTEPILPLMAVIVAFPLIVRRGPGWQGTVFHLGFGLIVSLVTFLNFQPLVPFQRAAGDPNSFAVPNVAFRYLYKGDSEGNVQLQYIPMIIYINNHLSAKQDKIYDYSALALYAGYSDVRFFSASPSLSATLRWDMYGADALDHFKQEHITYVSTLASDMDKLRQAPIAPYLQEVHRTADGQVLLKVHYG